MVDAGFFSNEEPSFKARQLFFQQKVDTVDLYHVFVLLVERLYNRFIKMRLGEKLIEYINREKKY